ncbi:hypothetical protein [Phyllobacterium sophorae]|nr:hypothetical protein [Phyllobacterium sophorae]
MYAGEVVQQGPTLEPNAINSEIARSAGTLLQADRRASRKTHRGCAAARELAMIIWHMLNADYISAGVARP